MSVASTRTLQIEFSGDIQIDVIKSAAVNSVAPGVSQVQTLAVGANTISIPTVSGVTPKGLTIIPPAGNTSAMVLKGVTGDTGIPLHLTDPTSIGLASSFTSLVITVSTANIIGIRFIWS